MTWRQRFRMNARLAATSAFLSGCATVTEPGAELRIESVHLTHGGGAALEIGATVVNESRRPLFAEACGGVIAPLVELYRGGTRADTWGNLCLADRSISPVAIPSGRAVPVTRAIQASAGATYRIGIRFTTEPGTDRWTTVWASAVGLP